MTVDFVLLCVLIGLLPAWIANRKGYNFLTWWIFGALLFLLALPLALMMKPDGGRRRACPSCMEWIDKRAVACPKCGRDVPPIHAPAS